MGTQSEWAYTDIQTPKTVKTAHKISLVSPRMDVDVTGVSLKNVRTHLIDHPRDEGLKHREQLWNFQQKYRGAVAKVRQGSNSVEDRKCETSGSDEQPEVLEDFRQYEDLRPRYPGDQSSLPSRFRRRLRQKLSYVGLRSSEYYTSSGKSRSLPPKDQKDDDKSNPGIQRMYSSGLLAKSNLYNQLRNNNGDDRKVESYGDNSRIIEAIQKYGSLEKLPDITYPALKSTQTPNIRFLKTLSTYNKRLIDQGAERRLISLRRSFTNIGDLVSSKRKLIIVSRRHTDDKLIKLGCIDPYNEDGEDEEDEDDDDEENDREREDGEGQNDDDDECDNENQIENSEKLHMRDCDQKNPEHLRIRDNITHVTSQDDTVLYDRHKHEEHDDQKQQLRSEKTFHGETRKTSEENRREYRRTDLAPQEPYIPKPNRQIKESWNQTKVGTSASVKEKDVTKERTVNSKRSKQKKDGKGNIVEDEESDDSLDIPEDKYGPTTHSIDRKLAIRKPWEWKPSPYRWIDKPYIRESDKPYIERIINKGEIIDEFHYDSFARTKPLKVQDYPEGAGYKDRYGVMR